MPNKSLYLKLWDLAGNCLQTFVGNTDWVLSANFSPNGKQIVSASIDNNLKLWDLAGKAETICLPSGLKSILETSAVCPTKVCRQLPAKSQSLRLQS
jgi:WD40 repeat protein